MDTNFSDIKNLDILEKIKDFENRVEEGMKKMDNLNIITIGKTGVGKSTIINAIFGDNLAKTGIGKPVTQNCDAYTIPGSPITIYDSKGLETGADNTGIFDEIYNNIRKQNSSTNTKEYIHICWYCVLDDGNRLDENELKMIEKIQKIIPVIIVLTQSVGGNKTDEFIGEIKKNFTYAIDIIPIMAEQKIEESDYGQTHVKSHGLDKLVEISYNLLPESVKKTFAAWQTTSIKLKTDEAFEAVLLYSGAVAAAAFQPLPIADAPIMIAIQITMMANITACFGLSPSTFDFKTIISGLGGPFASAVVGRTLVSLLKLIPGVGTLFGGAINAATGAAITFALGSVYIEVLSSIVENNGKIDKDKVIETLNKAAKNVDLDKMKKEWEKNKNSYSEAEAQRIAKEAKEKI
jgi:uncharacterized protein (DUF697 family)/GTP-binding protein EngB required for normal cell division